MRIITSASVSFHNRHFATCSLVRLAADWIIVLFACVTFAARVDAATFFVNSTGDLNDTSPGDGNCDTGQMVGMVAECTLRAAIQQANFIAGADVINFNIPGAGVHMIQPNSTMDSVTDAVLIDGFSQPGATAVKNSSRLLGPDDVDLTLLIQFDGSSPNFPPANQFGSYGLVLASGASTVQGISFTRFPQHGLVMASAAGATAYRNYIGLAPDGSAAGNGNGISASSRVVIEENVIGSNNGHGIQLAQITGPTLVLNNLIGTSPSGTAARPNTTVGIRLLDVGVEIRQNQVSANSEAGIRLECNSSFCEAVSPLSIHHNLIGTTFGGNSALGNAIGMVMNTFSRMTSAIEIADNVISGSFGPGGTGNGIAVIGDNMVIRDNRIGTGADPAITLGNEAEGMVLSLARNNTIQDNVIANNAIAGIGVGTIADDITETGGNTISGNSIYANSGVSGRGLGIDLARNGVSLNDATDNDNGPNGYQNFPVLDNVTSGGGQTRFIGHYQGMSNTFMTFEFFSNDACDPSGYGEGQYFWGVGSGTTNGSGALPIDVTLAGNLPGSVYTATATDPAGNTSEFSACFPQAAYGVRDSLAPEDDHELPFGNVTPNDSATATVTIGNFGADPLNITSVGTGTDPADSINAPFELTRDLCTGVQLLAGNECEFDVRFAPVQAGSFDDQFSIAVSLSTGPEKVAMSANGNSLVNGADLSIKKFVDRDAADVGDLLLYTVTLTNFGPDLAAGIVVEDLLPPELAFVSYTTDTGGTIYDPVSGRWDVGVLSATAPDNVATLRLDVEVLATANGTVVTNTATLLPGFSPADPDSNDHSASAETGIGGADMEVVSLRLNHYLFYFLPSTNLEVYVRNNGPHDARGIVIDFDAPNLLYTEVVVVTGNAFARRLQCVYEPISVATGAPRFHCVLPNPSSITAGETWLVGVDFRGILSRLDFQGAFFTVTVSADTLDLQPGNDSLSIAADGAFEGITKTQKGGGAMGIPFLCFLGLLVFLMQRRRSPIGSPNMTGHAQ